MTIKERSFSELLDNERKAVEKYNFAMGEIDFEIAKHYELTKEDKSEGYIEYAEKTHKDTMDKLLIKKELRETDLKKARENISEYLRKIL